MKVLFLTKYTYEGASSRYRIYQYISIFTKKGIECIISPFFCDKYIKLLYSNKHISSYLLIKYLIRRIIILLSSRKYDLLVIEKELIPYFPPLFEYILHKLKIKYILDYDDAIFHNYDKNNLLIIRKLLGKKINRVMSWASYIVTGSAYLTEYAKKYNKNVIEIPTVVDISKYKLAKKKEDNEFIIGWIGSPSSSEYLISILSSLKKFSTTYNCKIKIIGFDKRLVHILTDLPLEIIEWNEDTEIEEISSFTVGIMPLINSPFAKGKCGFKLIQYMACGMPIIASPIGANLNIVEHNINGFLADNYQDWFKYLEILYSNNELRSYMGNKGKKIVKNKYSLQITSIRYIDIIKKCNNR